MGFFSKKKEEKSSSINGNPGNDFNYDNFSLLKQHGYSLDFIPEDRGIEGNRLVRLRKETQCLQNWLKEVKYLEDKVNKLKKHASAGGGTMIDKYREIYDDVFLEDFKNPNSDFNKRAREELYKLYLIMYKYAMNVGFVMRNGYGDWDAIAPKEYSNFPDITHSEQIKKLWSDLMTVISPLRPFGYVNRYNFTPGKAIETPDGKKLYSFTEENISERIYKEVIWPELERYHLNGHDGVGTGDPMEDLKDGMWLYTWHEEHLMEKYRDILCLTSPEFCSIELNNSAKIPFYTWGYNIVDYSRLKQSFKEVLKKINPGETIKFCNCYANYVLKKESSDFDIPQDLPVKIYPWKTDLNKSNVEPIGIIRESSSDEEYQKVIIDILKYSYLGNYNDCIVNEISGHVLQPQYLIGGPFGSEGLEIKPAIAPWVPYIGNKAVNYKELSQKEKAEAKRAGEKPVQTAKYFIITDHLGTFKNCFASQLKNLGYKIEEVPEGCLAKVEQTDEYKAWEEKFSDNHD